MSSLNKILICVLGPTASGKTSLAIRLAKHYKTEIISADSRQFYKEMQIGTAVPSVEELASAPHHFVQHKSIFEDYTVGDFEKDFLVKSEKLFKNHKYLILVGGSGLYIDAAVKGLDNLPVKNEKIRKELEEKLNKEGIESLQKKLKGLDEEHYNQIDTQNPHRLIRSIEILLQSDKKMLDLRTSVKPKRNFKTIYIGLNTDRDLLYERINRRVDLMMQEGLLSEVKALEQHKELNALNTVGYKELFSYLDNEISLDFAISEIKKNTRRYAKRQLTWYRKNEQINWFDVHHDLNEIIKRIDFFSKNT